MRGQVAAADAPGRAGVLEAGPRCAGVVRAIKARAAGEGHGGVDAARVGGGDAEVDLNDRLGKIELAPGRAAVGRLVETARRAAPGGVLPRALSGFPESGVDDGRIRRIECDFRAAGVDVDVEDTLEALAAVERAVDAAFFVRAVRVAEDRGEDATGVPRVDDDLRDLLAVAQAEMGPGAAGVGRLVDAIADGEVGPLQALARSDIDDVGIRRRDGDRPDGAGRLVVKDGAPDPAVVGRLPHAAVADADVEDVGLRRNARDGPGAAGPVGADRPPAHFAEHPLVEGLGCKRGRCDDGGGQQEAGRGQED